MTKFIIWKPESQTRDQIGYCATKQTQYEAE